MTLKTLNTKEGFAAFIGSNDIAVVHFAAPWAAQCETMNTVLEELQKQDEYKNVQFSSCQAEELSEISLHYKISAVPTIIIFKSGKPAETINGANPADLTSKLKKVLGGAASNANDNQNLDARLKALVSKSNVMIFMKGNPQQPRCGFSRTLVGILDETKIPYETFDILQDEDVRQGLKTFSNWPTYPQIYVKGELVGGLDIIKELKESGELESTLKGN